MIAGFNTGAPRSGVPLRNASEHRLQRGRSREGRVGRGTACHTFGVAWVPASDPGPPLSQCQHVSIDLTALHIGCDQREGGRWTGNGLTD